MADQIKIKLKISRNINGVNFEFCVWNSFFVFKPNFNPGILLLTLLGAFAGIAAAKVSTVSDTAVILGFCF